MLSWAWLCFAMFSITSSACIERARGRFGLMCGVPPFKPAALPEVGGLIPTHAVAIVLLGGGVCVAGSGAGRAIAARVPILPGAGCAG